MTDIFIRDATLLDCAVLDPLRGVRGASWHVDIRWSGNVGEDGMLLDFSEAKRVAKGAIDAAFDHRLLASVEQGTAYQEQATGSRRVALGGTYLIDEVRHPFALDTYAASVALLPADAMDALAQETPSLEALAELVGAAVQAASPEQVTRVQVTLRPSRAETRPNAFAYTHSLPRHCGNCQRFHGHSNCIEVLRAGEFDTELSTRAARLARDRFFVRESYVTECETRPEELAGIAGRLPRGRWACAAGLVAETAQLDFVSWTGDQGSVRAILPRTAVVRLPGEASIENMARRLFDELGLGASREAHELRAYEGLAKGAIVR